MDPRQALIDALDALVQVNNDDDAGYPDPIATREAVERAVERLEALASWLRMRGYAPTVSRIPSMNMRQAAYVID